MVPPWWAVSRARPAAAGFTFLLGDVRETFRKVR